MPIVLLDDQPEHVALLQLLLRQICEEDGVDADIAVVASAPEPMLAFAADNHGPALYFLDIELSRPQNGIDVCNQIRQLDQNAFFIYVSAHQRYALQCLKTHAFDFLLKPFTKVELRECLLAAVAEAKRRTSVIPLSISSQFSTIVLDQNELIYFSIKRNLITAHGTANPYTWRSSYRQLTPLLHPNKFVQIHRSYLVNKQKIQEVLWDEDMVVLQTGISLPISRRSKSLLREALGGPCQEA